MWVARLAGLFCLAACAWLLAGGQASAAPLHETAIPAAPTPKLAWVGRVLTRVTARAAPRFSARATTVLRPIAPIGDGPTVLSITGTLVRDGRRWVQVLLPIRPNGSRGWVPVDVLALGRTNARVVIDTGDRRLELYRAGRRVMRVPVAVGKAGTPTPHGASFAIAERIATNIPGAFLGPIVFPLTAYSEKLNEFAGGDGRVAIHGTSLPHLIGTRASNGCIRMYNADVQRLARSIRLGTPVTIRG
jgi:lipoprotein-anchoring transpeptidase ErfK/SrfK